MDTEGMGWISSIIVGGLAGWLAQNFMKTNTGIFLNIILGIVGASIATMLLRLIGIHFTGWLGYLVAGFIGACILVAIGRAIKR